MAEQHRFLEAVARTAVDLLGAERVLLTSTNPAVLVLSDAGAHGDAEAHDAAQRILPDPPPGGLRRYDGPRPLGYDWTVVVALPGGGGRLCAFGNGPCAISEDDSATLIDLGSLAAARLSSGRKDAPDVPPEARALARFGYFTVERASGAVRWSEEVAHLYGWEPSQPAPTLATVLCVFPCAAQSQLRHGVAHSWKTGEEVAVTSSITRSDGVTRDVLVRFRADEAVDGGKRTSLSGIMIDVTEARSFDERLRREKELLQATLTYMDQGLMVVEPDMSVPVLSRRTAEILALPMAFVDAPPTFPEILAFQSETGAISEEMIRSSINSFILDGDELPETHVFERETFDGKMVEVRTTRLPHGGFVRTFTDQTARRRREQDIARAQAEYRLLFENSVVGIYRSSSDGQPIRVNPALVRINGYDDEAEFLTALTDINTEFYVQPGRRDIFQQLLHRDGRITDFVSEVYRHKTGERIWVTETAWIIRDAEGGILGFEGMISDITPRKMAEERVARMARFDELTGLPNRARLNESLGSALASDARGTIVLCLDLDRFKIVNDTLGHPAGDALLRAMAQRFAALATAGDTVARLGGDEFAFVLTGSTKAAAAALAARIVAATDTPVIIEERPIQVGVSVGIAQGSHDCDDPVQLMKRADLALYRAKAAGRSTHRFFSPEMDAALAERQGLELDLRQALESSQFKVFYQPIVDLADGRVAGVEALLRWTHPTRGSIPPDTFIAIAEETRLIVPIGEWVLNRACRDARHLPQGVSVSVNVSTIQLAQCDFEAVLARALAASGLPAERLVIEITETTLMDARVNVAPMLARLRARGIRLALDDFGTGYSSLGYLRSFDFDILKLAHAFIGNLVEQETAAIVETVLQLGERLGIATTAEGIETPEQLAALRSGRCRYGQGRLFGDPRDLSSLLADGLCSAAAAWRAHDLQLDPAKETR